MKKKRINIYLPAELYTKLKQIVDCWGSSVNGYLVWLIGNEVYDFEQFSEQENSLDDAKLVRRSFTDISEKTCYLEYNEWIPSGGDKCDLEWEWRCSKSPVMKTNDLLFTSTNQEFARRLYCGVVWTHDALIFAETYYQYRD